MKNMRAWMIVIATAAVLSACGACPSDFHEACAKRGCGQAVRDALKKDASLANKPDARGAFPLNLAADRAAAEALLDAGADINAVSPKDQLTPLSEAYTADRGDVFSLLLERGGKNADLGHWLSLAVAADRVAVAEVLLDKGADVNAVLTTGDGIQLTPGGGFKMGASTDHTTLQLARSDKMRDLLKKHGAR